MMQKYCSDNGVPYKPIGKLVVATRESEIPKLNELLIRGNENGLQGLRMLDGSEAMRMEPELQCIRALYSPLSGIVDAHSLMLSLLGDAQKHGATISYNTTVVGGHIQGNQLQLHVITTLNTETLNENGESINLQPERVLVPKIVINSAGLAAIPLARQFTGLDSVAIPFPAAKYVRGSYFTLSKNETPFRHLIYPIPEVGGLGIHVTLDLNGQVKFGPDVEWIHGLDGIPSFLNKFDYSVSIDRARDFYTQIRKYYPSLKDGSLEPGYTGIRPKLSGPGEPPADFVIQGEDVHGVQGLVNLFGIDSPGLSSCLAIAEHVASMLLP